MLAPARGVGLAEVLRRHGPAYLAAHPLSVAQAKVWRAILACRTPVLGGHVETCAACGTTRRLYHSCRNRHCPRCQTRAKEAWLAARRREVLPVPYFHLVFTLPHDLNALIGQCPRALYEMLFGAVSATPTEFAANPRWLGGTAAFSLVLHTWKQDLGRHVHLHALVPGGALKADGAWVAAKRGFLFPISALSEVFRGKFVAALKAARQSGKLRTEERLPPEAPWGALLARLYAHDWVVYAKQSPGGPEQVLEYLGRYTHRVAVSNERILGLDADTVRLRVRDSAHGNRRRTLSVPAHTFIERFLLHVLPKGFKRIRHYGLLGPAGKAAKLAQARSALSAPTPDPVVVESLQAFMQRIDRIEWSRSPALRQRQTRAQRTHRAHAGAGTPSAGTAVRVALRSGFVCRAPGAGLRQGPARPLGPVRTKWAFARACSRSSLQLLVVANARMLHHRCTQRPAKRRHRAPAPLQSP